MFFPSFFNKRTRNVGGNMFGEEPEEVDIRMCACNNIHSSNTIVRQEIEREKKNRK